MQWPFAAFIPGYSGGTAAAFTAFRSPETRLICEYYISIKVKNCQDKKYIFMRFFKVNNYNQKGLLELL